MKTRMVVCGAGGRMGKLLVRLVAEEPRAELAAAVETARHSSLGADAGELAGVGRLGVPVRAQYRPEPQTVTLDFTTPSGTLEHVKVAAESGAGIVIGTTGFTAGEHRELERLAVKTRAVLAPNMSLGVNVLMKLVRTAAVALGPAFDIEILEMHHRQKIDAPSGTALELGRLAAEATGRDFGQVARFTRHGATGSRRREEIGIAALRGGDTVGDHTVVFAGSGERLELTHRAQSRDCLARGALAAALWLADRPPGLYSMADVLGLGDGAGGS